MGKTNKSSKPPTSQPKIVLLSMKTIPLHMLENSLARKAYCTYSFHLHELRAQRNVVSMAMALWVSLPSESRCRTLLISFRKISRFPKVSSGSLWLRKIKKTDCEECANCKLGWCQQSHSLSDTEQTLHSQLQFAWTNLPLPLRGSTQGFTPRVIWKCLKSKAGHVRGKVSFAGVAQMSLRHGSKRAGHKPKLPKTSSSSGTIGAHTLQQCALNWNHLMCETDCSSRSARSHPQLDGYITPPILVGVKWAYLVSHG